MISPSSNLRILAKLSRIESSMNLIMGDFNPSLPLEVSSTLIYARPFAPKVATKLV